VTEITEQDESSYVYSEELLVDSVGNISASGFSIYTSHENGDKLLIRMDADANLGWNPGDILPGEWAYVAGIGTQFDNSFPFTEGYQLLATGFTTIVDGLEILETKAVSMLPNPAISLIYLKSDFQINQVNIYSLEGKSWIQQKANRPYTEVEISSLPAGMFVVKAVTENGIWTSLLTVVK
jgi:hypothetical protein